MFFFFSKLLFFLLSPLTWVFILLLLSWFFQKNQKGKKFLLYGIGILYLFSNSFIRKEVYRYWEYPFTNPPGIYDYAVILGGFSSYDYDASRLKFSEAGDRFFQAYQLYQQGRVKKLFISGGSGSLLHQERTESDKVRDFVLSLNIPGEDIIVENYSRNTHENATNTRKWLEKNDPTAQSLLITSASHMPRALGCYKKAGVKVFPYTTDRLTQPREFDPENLFVPDAENLDKWRVLIKEIIGILVYKIMGYL